MSFGTGQVGRRIAIAMVLVGLMSAVGTVWFWTRPPVSAPLRVGYRHSPPYYFAEAGQPPRGMAIEVLGVAAERLAIPLQWRRIGDTTPSDQAILSGEIDMWPTLTVRPGRSVPLYLTDAWLLSEYFLIVPAGSPIRTAQDMARRRLAFMPRWAEGTHVEGLFPDVVKVARESSIEKLQAFCSGQADAALVEGREGQALLMARPAGCEQMPVDFRRIEGANWPHAIATRVESRRAADALRAEIARMGEDGTLTRILGRWSFTTTNETQIVTALQESRRRTRLSLLAIVAMGVALILSLWQIRRNRVARRLAEAATASLQAHARTQERYRALFERNAAGVVRSTPDGRILDCNQALATALGYDSPEELLSKSAWDLYPDRRVRDTILARLETDGSIINQELTLRRKDGTPVQVLQNISLDRGKHPGEATLEGTLIDVTELRRLEEQYRQAQKLESVGRLAGGVAHDFNNLLTAITGYAELVLVDLPPQSPLRDSVEEIRKASQQAASLTQQLLAFSRKQLLQFEILDVNAVVNDSLKLLRRVIGEDVEIVTLLDDQVGHLAADRGQLVQVIMNLAVNARDAMPQGGRLTIETHNVTVEERDFPGDPDAILGPCVLLAISDTGVGMDEETSRHIFEPFFTTKERGKGTGLGLSTVYGIIKQSGAHIRVTTELGHGTRFDIYFPRTEAPLGQRPAAQGASQTATGSETVLVAEDQDEVRRLANRALSRQGYRVLTAANGAEAIEICRSLDVPIDLLVSDVVMPGMSGPHLAASLARRYPAMKVLFMSGYSDNMINFGIQPGSVEYLQKPFTPRDLAEKVRQVLENHASAC